MRDSRCAKDSSTATEQARNARERARGSSINKLKKMFLMAFRLSGNPLKCREFLRGLGTSSYNFGDVELSNSTHLTLQRELHFVVAYKLIVSHLLHPKLKNGTGYVV